MKKLSDTANDYVWGVTVLGLWLVLLSIPHWVS